MKVAVALVLLVAVSVGAHPGKYGNNRRCSPESNDCKCWKLMKSPPKEQEEETESPMAAAIAACETELSVTVPPAPEVGRRHQYRRLYNMPQEFKDCMRDNVLRTFGLMDEAGQISVTALQSEMTEKINANKGDDITSAQVQTIVDAVPTCVADNGGDQLQMGGFYRCMKTACVAALPAQ